MKNEDSLTPDVNATNFVGEPLSAAFVEVPVGQRRFTQAEKIAILEKFDRCERGSRGTFLRQNGLYSSVVYSSGFGLVRKVKTRHADGVAAAIVEALKPLKSLVRTITIDNGLEFEQHARITAETGAKVYFADPYSSWQRGTNENWNGLVRQDYPKKSCFSGNKAKQLLASQNALNNRARKRLDWMTPAEALAPSAKRAGVALAL